MESATPTLRPDVRADLRLAVHALRREERSRVFPPRVHVGELLGEAVSIVADDELDAGSCVDIAAALLASARVVHERPSAWLTRPGVPHPHDLDLQWFPPVQRAFAEADVEPTCLVVVTKSGWYEPLGDDRVEWKRLRIRS